MSERTIIDWPAWTAAPAGRYVLQWEQAQLDRAVSDMFGYRALQLGLPQLDALRENRMSGRGLVLDAASAASLPYTLPPASATSAAPGATTMPTLPVTSDTSAGSIAPAASPARAPDEKNVEGDPSRKSRESPDASAASAALASPGPFKPARPPAPDAPHTPHASHSPHAPQGRSAIWCDLLDLPFEAQSVDLIVMPHTLEFTHDPHRLLREVERALMPEGRLILTGFNSLSLWRARQSLGKLTGRAFIPDCHDPIAFTRLKDWLKLLGFELERGRFGCYRPPLTSETWLARHAFMEAAGDRWWPIFGAVYMVTAIKRVRSLRLIGPRKAKKTVLAPGLTPAATPSAPISPISPITPIAPVAPLSPITPIAPATPTHPPPACRKES